MEDGGRLSADLQTALTAVDWAQPWLASVAQRGQAVAAQVLQGQPVHAALNLHLPAALQQQGLRFVAQQALPAGQAYEGFIYAQRCVPTRENLHDFFNGLIWLHWPQLKLHLNRLQATAIAQAGVGQHRGPLRDAITVLDENGAIWLAPPVLVQALQQRQWQRLMGELRPLWAHSCLWPVGHALLEKLVQPRKPITAHVLCLPWADAGMAAATALGAQADHISPPLDAAVAQDALVQADTLARKPFSPLPVLGVPGWWLQNEELSFYDDPHVFRAARLAAGAQCMRVHGLNLGHAAPISEPNTAFPSPRRT